MVIENFAPLSDTSVKRKARALNLDRPPTSQVMP